MQITINGTDWVQIAPAGKSVTVRLDEQDDGAKGHCDVRVIASVAKPDNTEAVFTQAKKVYKPSGNGDSLFLDPRNEDYSFWAKTGATADEALLDVVEDGIGYPKHVDASIQDATNPFAPSYFVRQEGSAVLAAQASINTRSVTLEAGHGFVNGTAGQVLVIEGSYVGQVTAVVGDVVAVDTPLNYTYLAGTAVIRGDIFMNKNGSVTPLVYVYRAVAGRKFHVKEINVSIIDSSAMGDGLFGGDSAKTNGMVLRVKKSAAWYNNIANIKKNGTVRLYGTLVYSDKPPADKYGCSFSFPLVDKYGSIAQLDGNKGQELQIVIQDDMSGLDEMRATALSHVVED